MSTKLTWKPTGKRSGRRTVSGKSGLHLILLAVALLFVSRRNDGGTWRRTTGVTAFTMPTTGKQTRPISVTKSGDRSLPSTSPTATGRRTSLCSMGDDIFEGFKRFFGGANESDGDNETQSNLDREDDDDLPAGTTLLLSIPAKQIKAGGLRLFVMFYLLGMQNTPHANAWKANQPVTASSSSASESSDYILEMYFHDATGMIQIEFLDRSGNTDANQKGHSEIRVLRCGSVPSTAYLMQESVIVDGILDELQQCAFDESIAPQDRLLVPEPETAIDDARQALSFG